MIILIYSTSSTMLMNPPGRTSLRWCADRAAASSSECSVGHPPAVGLGKMVEDGIRHSIIALFSLGRSSKVDENGLRHFIKLCSFLVFFSLCSPPARWGLLDFIRVVALLLLATLVLLLLLLASSAMSASTSTSTSALPTLRQALRQLPSSVCTAGPQPGAFPAQCAPLDLNLGPSQLSVHRWTSTWDLPSSVCTAGPQPVCTAGPQPGAFPAQCAPLDLNLGPSQLSVHRWTSTWDLPSSVCTAGPQPGTFPAQCAPLDLNLGPSQLSVHRWTSTAR